ncbi:MAG: phage head-tail connector protein, partial [Methylocystis sp.]|nr:phage head-tail connector protein [Methylocystis sp.]
MTPILLAGPLVEPVSLADAKAWLRLDTSDEDDLVAALIVSARMTLEAYTRRFFITQNWRIKLDAWPITLRERTPATLAIPFAPLQSVAAIRVYDAANAAQVLDQATYLAPAAPDRARVSFVTQPPTPARLSDGIEIDVVVGYGAPATDTPEPLRRAILMLVAHWHENRGDQPADA